MRDSLHRRQEYLPEEVSADAIPEHVVSGGLWSGAGLAATLLLQFVRSMVLARLLPPSAFGTLNLANVFTQFILLFANFGFTSSLIYGRRLGKIDLSTCWWGNLIVDSVAAAMCCIFAFTGARFLATPEVKWLIVLLSTQFVLGGAGSVHGALMRRQFKFRAAALVNVGVATTSFATACVLVAVLHWGVFGIVVSMIVGSAVTNLLSLVVIPWLPSRAFSWMVLKKHARYGRWFLGTNVVNYSNQNMERALIGTTLNSTQLGYYSYASDLPTTATMQLTYAINFVLFPAFANLQNDLVELRRVLLRVMRFNALIVYPLLTGLAVSAGEFVRVAYGPTWVPIVGPMRIFCLFGMIRVLTSNADTLCAGVGKPHMPFKWCLMALPLNAALLWWSVRAGGLVGVALAKLFLPVFMLATLVVEITRAVGMPIRQVGYAALPAFVCCLIMSAVMLGVGALLGSHAVGPVVQLVLKVLTGAVAYSAALRVLYPSEFGAVLSLAKRLKPAR